jgi:hypothetical protein
VSVTVDDHGVTQRSLFRSRTLAWAEIDDYRLTIQPHAHRTATEIVVEAIQARGAHDVHLDHAYFRMQLLGASRELTFNGWFFDVAQAANLVFARIHERLSALAAAALAQDGVARFGPLTLADHGIQWLDRPAVPREAIDSVEVFDSSPVSLRVTARGKILPYGKASTAKIPNIGAALDLAAGLGYRVRGRDLFTALGLVEIRHDHVPPRL